MIYFYNCGNGVLNQKLFLLINITTGNNAIVKFSTALSSAIYFYKNATDKSNECHYIIMFFEMLKTCRKFVWICRLAYKNVGEQINLNMNYFRKLFSMINVYIDYHWQGYKYLMHYIG